MHTLSFQARGASFRPSAMALAFAESFEPGCVATFGGNRGTAVPYGAALYVVPELPRSGRDSDFTVAVNHLLTLQGAFRGAGATEFVLHLHRVFGSQCNEEFSRDELRLLASLDCHLFYQARHASEGET
jgi:hypothetical protein